MTATMLIDSTYDNEVRVAVVGEHGKLNKIQFQPHHRQSIKGNIYWGKITHIDANIKAAFVDLGLKNAGFLSLKNQEILKSLSKGQMILVQVLKDARGHKQVSLTTNLTLMGHSCILTSTSGINPSSQALTGVSRKITTSSERERLKTVIAEINLPDDLGIIIRTAGAEQDASVLKKDIRSLIRLWKDIHKRVQNLKIPQLIYEEENILYQAIRDLYNKDIENIYVQSYPLYQIVRKCMRFFAPSHRSQVLQWKETTPLFDAFGMEEQVKSLFQPTIQLPSGGNIVLNMTEALCAIDVNSAKSDALQTNLEAVEEVARQIMLRDIAGIIVIDLIDMDTDDQRDDVQKAFKQHLKPDTAKINLLKINELGLLELSRQRIRTSFLDTHMIRCPQCKGHGIVQNMDMMAFDILKALAHVAENGKKLSIIRLFVASIVGEYLFNQKKQYLVHIEQQYNLEIHVVFDNHIDFSSYRIET